MAPTGPAAPRSPAWRERFRGQFRKTKLCRFNNAGQCRYGEGCPFAHSEKDIEHTPDLTKTSLCLNFQNGTCELSKEECPFAHGDEELRVTPAFTRAPLSRRTRAFAAAVEQKQAAGDGEDQASTCGTSDGGPGRNLQDADLATSEGSSPRPALQAAGSATAASSASSDGAEPGEDGGFEDVGDEHEAAAAKHSKGGQSSLLAEQRRPHWEAWADVVDVVEQPEQLPRPVPVQPGLLRSRQDRAAAPQAAPATADQVATATGSRRNRQARRNSAGGGGGRTLPPTIPVGRPSTGSGAAGRLAGISPTTTTMTSNQHPGPVLPPGAIHAINSVPEYSRAVPTSAYAPVGTCYPVFGRYASYDMAHAYDMHPAVYAATAAGQGAREAYNATACCGISDSNSPVYELFDATTPATKQHLVQALDDVSPSSAAFDSLHAKHLEEMLRQAMPDHYED